MPQVLTDKLIVHFYKCAKKDYTFSPEIVKALIEKIWHLEGHIEGANPTQTLGE